MGFITRLIISALSLGVAAYIIPGIYIDNMMTLLVAAFLLGLVNAVVRPVLFLLTLPVTIVTLGLFLLVLNGAMIVLVAWLLPGFSVSGLGSAILGWLIISLVSWIASQIFGN
ncbi:MAG: phage holin family protein [Chitinispirillaceae bacterium]